MSKRVYFVIGILFAVLLLIKFFRFTFGDLQMEGVSGGLLSFSFAIISSTCFALSANSKKSN